MVRRAEGWKLREDRRTGIQFVRFRHARKRHEVSTGKRDLDEATREAAIIYAAIVSGRWERHVIVSRPGQPFDEVAAQWLAEVKPECDPKTWKLYVVHVKHLAGFFRTLDRVTESSVGDYRRARLRKVLRSTLVHELTTLRRFLRWAKENRYLAELPKVPSPPPSAIGTPDARPHKRKPVPLTELEARAIIAALPVKASRARRGGAPPHPVRDFFLVLWETGLRPETVCKLAAPTHFRRGADALHITADIDKVRYARELPLTPRCRRALERWAPDAGLIFGRHDYRVPFRAACRAADLERWKAEQVTPYDFRHGRTTDLLGRPGATLPGVSYLVGHRQVTTTNRYVRAPLAAAKATLLGGQRGAGRKRGAGKR